MKHNDDTANPHRRGFLSTTLKAIPAAMVATVGLTKTAQAIPGAPGSADSLSALREQSESYRPTFFNAAQYALIRQAVDLLIPDDEHGPGALAAGVPQYIDIQMDTPYAHGQLWYMKGPFHPEIMARIPTLGYQLNMTPREIYQSGLQAFDDWCTQQYGAEFVHLNHDQQTDALTQLSENKLNFAAEAVPASVFFSQLWNHTKEGFFADPMYAGNRQMGGWQMLGFPGVRGDYLDWANRYNVVYPIQPVSILGGSGSQGGQSS